MANSWLMMVAGVTWDGGFPMVLPRTCCPGHPGSQLRQHKASTTIYTPRIQGTKIKAAEAAKTAGPTTHQYQGCAGPPEAGTRDQHSAPGIQVPRLDQGRALEGLAFLTRSPKPDTPCMVYFHLHNWVILQVNVGKYTMHDAIHGVFGQGFFGLPLDPALKPFGSCHEAFFAKRQMYKKPVEGGALSEAELPELGYRKGGWVLDFVDDLLGPHTPNHLSIKETIKVLRYGCEIRVLVATIVVNGTYSG